MGTRGALGVFIDGQTKATYNHFDSYPDGLGSWMVKAVRDIINDPERGLDWMKEKARAIQMWPADKPVTLELINQLRAYADTSVSRQSITDLYCLTREMQGDLEAYLKEGVMPDGGKAFLGDGLFCEYAYIVNLDDEILEFYKGFQKEPHEKGRYAAMPAKECVGGSTYYPVALVGSFPLTAIPDDWEKQLFPREDDED